MARRVAGLARVAALGLVVSAVAGCDKPAPDVGATSTDAKKPPTDMF